MERAGEHGGAAAAPAGEVVCGRCAAEEEEEEEEEEQEELLCGAKFTLCRSAAPQEVAEMGVVSIHTPRGMTMEVWQRGLQEWRDAQG